MISFALRCAPHSHGFDGWFRSGNDFERQVSARLVTCPVCGSSDVSKALMKPAIGRMSSAGRVADGHEETGKAHSTSDGLATGDGSSTGDGSASPVGKSGGEVAAAGQSRPDASQAVTEGSATGPTGAGPAGTVAVGAAAEVIGRLQAVARELRAKSDYVGSRFAEEARKIHFGETRNRSIYGEASKAEVEKLSEDGITAIPLPALPEDAN